MQQIILAVTLCSVTTLAYGQNDFYASIGGGWTIPTRNSIDNGDSSYVVYGPTTAPSTVSIFNLPNVKWENKYKQGFNLNLAVGYTFSRTWRSDIEFIYQRFNRKVVGTYSWREYDAISLATIDTKNNIPLTPSKGVTKVYSLLTNGYYDFKNNSKWTPLLGAGFGIAWLQAKQTTASGSFLAPLNVNATPTFQRSPALSGTAFAWQIKAGVAYGWQEYASIVMQYRLFMTSKFIAQISSITTNPNAGSSTRTFTVSQDTIKGLMTNALEVAFQFKIA